MLSLNTVLPGPLWKCLNQLRFIFGSNIFALLQTALTHALISTFLLPRHYKYAHSARTVQAQCVACRACNKHSYNTLMRKTFLASPMCHLVKKARTPPPHPHPHAWLDNSDTRLCILRHAQTLFLWLKLPRKKHTKRCFIFWVIFDKN